MPKRSPAEEQFQQCSIQETLMSSFPVTKRKRATRAKFVKVRTGCVTCKKRHVKCDESKPACKNCMKWAGFCGGYEAILSHSQLAKPHSALRKPLIMALSNPDLEVISSPEELEMTSPDCTWQLQSSGGMSPTFSINSQSSPHTYPSHPDHDATTSSPITPSGLLFDDLFWETTLAQLIQDNAAIRCANLAVHTLIHAKNPDVASVGKVAEKDYYGEALICYGLALSEIRRIASQQTDLREAIICCMFFVIFETINGDRAAAQAHLQSGQRLLSELGAELFHQNLHELLQYLAYQARKQDCSGRDGFFGESRSSILESLAL